MKSPKRTVGRRFVATLGAATLGLVGVAGLASADIGDLSIANINPEAEGVINIDKFVTPDPAWETDANGKQITVPADAERLGGVTFEIVRVNSIGSGSGAVPLDLTTPEGWDAAADLDPMAVDASRHGNTPAFDFGNATNVVTSTSGPVPSGNLPIGLYLVHEISAGNNPITAPTPPSLVTVPYPDTQNTEWLYDIYLYPKNDVSGDETTKEVKNPNQVVLPDGSVVTTDALVDWVIRVPLFNFGDEDYETFEVVDTMDPKLEYVEGSAKVEVFSGAIANGTSQGTLVAEDDFDVTPGPGANQITVEATASGLDKLNQNKGTVTYVEVTITTKVLGDGILENSASSVVNDWTSTADPKPTTNWARLQILKYGGTDQTNTLQGAEFKVFKDRDEDGAGVGQVGGTYVTGPNGLIDITLWVGNNAAVTETYYIQETKAPAGYTLPEGEEAWHQVDLTANAQATVLVQPVQNIQHDSPELPITGAAGQLLMMIGGVALVLLGGGAALVASRRKQDA